MFLSVAASGCVTSSEFSRFSGIVEGRLDRVAASVATIDSSVGAAVARESEALGEDTAKLVADVEERVRAQVSAATDLVGLVSKNPGTALGGIAGLIYGAMKTTNIVRDRKRRLGIDVKPAPPAT